MSYGSTFVQFDPNGKLSSRLSRSHIRKGETERPHKIVQYEKQFDVSLSRVGEPGPDRSSVRDSMIAYSNKMRSIQDARHGSNNSQNDPLFVRAKHIPKHPVRAPKKRRPMSFDELLGRDRESARDRGTKSKPRPHSEKQKPEAEASKSDNEIRLPMLTERLRNSGPNVHVSLVSASDLYELVDFSLRSKTSKAETIQMINMEAESGLTPGRKNRAGNKFVEDVISREAYDKFERTQDSSRIVRKEFNEASDDDLVPSRSYYEQAFALDKHKPVVIPTETPAKTFSKLPSINNELFRRRPNRVKRMKLQDPALGDIPEDTVMETGEISKASQIEINRRVISPPPHRRSPKSIEFITKSPLEAIVEQTEKTNGVNKNENTQVNGDENDTAVSANVNKKAEEGVVYKSILPFMEDAKSTKKMLIRDDGDVRIEVTQCPPKQELNTKLKAQKRFSKKLIYLRDGAR